MAYPAPFHRLVLIGSLYGDSFNTTMSIIPVGGETLPAVSEDLIEAVADFVRLWWDNPLSSTPPYGCGISQKAILQSIKLNRIGTNGRYQDPVAREFVLTTPIPGAQAGAPPAQLSLAATFRGVNERARAGKGRMYFPPSAVTEVMQADGRISTTAATQYGNGVGALVGGLNDVYLTEGVVGVVGIASNVGTGAFQGVQKITIGRTVDTIRSRRNKIPEDYITVTTAP